MIPVLFTTYNRLHFTKIALPKLIESDTGTIYVIDNNSNDGTQEWLSELKCDKCRYISNRTNLGVGGVMNQFFKLTENYEYVAKVDNDTVVEKDWLTKLERISRSINIPLLQARHSLLRTGLLGFDRWMKTLKQHPRCREVYINNYIGGSGIIIKKDVVNSLPEKGRVLGGWNIWQMANPQIPKAFYTGTTLDLLDMNIDGSYKITNKDIGYYKETGRL
jgi:glycosyltransferase involved in cell wall biosynthesis